MVEFLLELYFVSDSLGKELSDDEDDAIVDQYIQKMVEMPAIPRVGEEIDMGDIFGVTLVTHQIKNGVIQVSCEVSLSQGVSAFVEDKQGWNLEHLDSGEELFYQKVKELEKRNEKI